MIQVSANIIRALQCGATLNPSNSGGGIATVRNSDSSYTQSGASPIILPDTTFNINVNGVLNQTIVSPSMQDETFNISA